MKKMIIHAHQFNKRFWHAPLMLLALAVVVFSVSLCTTPDAVEPEFMERTDIQVSGSLDLQAFAQSPPDAAAELVRLVSFGDPANRLDVEIRLSDIHVLILHVFDAGSPGTEVLANRAYNVYPPEEMEDKTFYVTAEIRQKGGETSTYLTQMGSNLPPGAVLNAVEFSLSGSTLQGRIRDLPLYLNTNTSNTVTVNGTFTAAWDAGVATK